MSISNDPLTKLIIQDIINTNNARATGFFFNTEINIKSLANFYVMSFSYFLTYYYFEECKNFNIKDNIS